MKREELLELHYITPIANVDSILSLGLVSNRRVRRLKLKNVSVAKIEVQDIRARKVVLGGRPLHDYVNLYIYARNSTLYLMRLKNPDKPLCVLRVSPDVLDLPDVVITDQNAASEWARFHPAPDGLAYIKKDVVFARSWKHPDDEKREWQHKSAMCAEVLVPDRVDPAFIMGAYVWCEEDRARLARIAPTLEVVVDSNLFFH